MTLLQMIVELDRLETQRDHASDSYERDSAKEEAILAKEQLKKKLKEILK